jgi:iron-sulfur cluster assembly protein
MQAMIDLPTNDPGLTVSDEALAHISRSLSKHKEAPIGIRIGVKKTGCSGYEYVLEYAYPKSPKEHDFVFSLEGITILIDKEIYLKFLKGGTKIDFRQEGFKEGLQFDNPNVGHKCGCGESFTLKDE